MNGNITIGVLLAITNVILMSTAAYNELICWANTRTIYKWANTKLIYGIMFLYFALVYLFLAYHDPREYDYVVFSLTFLRPAYTVLFGILCIGAIRRRKQCK